MLLRIRNVSIPFRFAVAFAFAFAFALNRTPSERTHKTRITCAGHRRPAALNASAARSSIISPRSSRSWLTASARPAE